MRCLVESSPTADAQKVARAELHLESQLPTRKLSLSEAHAWLSDIAHAEDIDPPVVIYGRISRCAHAVAVPDYHAIVVATKHPTQLTLLHELAHFMGSMGHGSHFEELLTYLIRRHISLQHSVAFKQGCNFSN
jgi:hypothetical protein